MSNRDFLEQLDKEQLIQLIENSAKNWLAMDGLWFQAVERASGMAQAMEHDVAVWRSFTVIEANRIKAFLNLPEQPGLPGLAQALQLRLYASLNEATIELSHQTLTYTMVSCRVQSARSRKGLPYHPCKAVGQVEYGLFARAIDPRISCQCLSCYPDATDPSCCCKWLFSIEA